MRVFIAGDTHGVPAEFRVLKDFSIQEGLTLDDIIVIAGDAGIYYGGFTSNDARQIAMQAPCKFLIVRGNHDDRIEDVINAAESKGCWSTQQLLGNTVYVHKKYPSLFYALDEGGIYHIDGEKVMIVPGAYSIDKFYRLADGHPYNPREQLTKNEMDALLDLAEENPDITGVIAHTAPLLWEPYFRDLFFGGINQEKVDKTTDKFLDALIERLPNLKHYYFGHFHSDRNCGDAGVMVYRKILEYGTKHQ